MDPQPQTPPAQASQPQPAQQAPAAPQPVPPPPVKKGGGFLGKLLLFIIIAGILIVGGYFLISMGYKTPTKITPITTETQVIPTQIPASPTTSNSKITKTVKAGLTTSKAFQAYSIELPPGWTDARETTVAADIDKLTLTKNGYSLTIYQAAMGGGGCIYPGDKPSEMAQSFTNFTNIDNKTGSASAQQYRRSWNTPGTEKTISYTICQKSATDDSFGSLTSYGGINAVSPNPADPNIMTELDSMITSLIKQ